MKKLALLVIALVAVSSLVFSAEQSSNMTVTTPMLNEQTANLTIGSTPIETTPMTKGEMSAQAATTTATTTTEIPAQTQAAAMMTLKGDIIDNMCAGAQKPEALAELVKTHSKMCALMPSCVASGYSIFADGKLQKFDMESNAMIEKFLKKEDSKLQVEVVAKEVGGNLSLVSIKNQM